MFRLVVYGNPIPKARHRTGSGHTYTPERTRTYEKVIALNARKVYKDAPVRGPLRVRLDFYRVNNRRCDLDNLVKSVLDGLQGVVFKDDSQICELYTMRHVDADNPRVEIAIREFRGSFLFTDFAQDYDDET